MSSTGEVGGKMQRSKGLSGNDRISMFHRVLERRMNANLKEETKSLLHRLFFLAKTSPELVNKRDLGGYYENLFQKLQRSGEGITGLLLLYSSHIIHVIESSSDVLYSVIGDLKDMQQQQERLFQQWEYNVLNITAKRLDDTLQGEPIEKIISECLTLLIKLGMHMQKTYKEFPNKPISSVLDNVPELIVPQELIQRLLKSNELLTPHQFLDIYNAPLSVIIDSELVWPKPERLLPESRK
ncbi:testis-expressed protein 47 isoform X3 [Hemiscyllium ocellatum]|uniref:testis-expressed protein 47 isoform X3 n=1 Tax=Hemiscyllium ocellatum TaxID=170820 RepID=UPI0029664C60|nr:testis-expressed protein 47 isoform X3 [Hemiscyllium ocellatum]